LFSFPSVQCVPLLFPPLFKQSNPSSYGLPPHEPASVVWPINLFPPFPLLFFSPTEVLSPQHSPPSSSTYPKNRSIVGSLNWSFAQFFFFWGGGARHPWFVLPIFFFLYFTFVILFPPLFVFSLVPVFFVGIHRFFRQRTNPIAWNPLFLSFDPVSCTAPLL